MYAANVKISRTSFLILLSKIFSYLFGLIATSSFFVVPRYSKTSSFIICSVHGIFHIRWQKYIFVASSFLPINWETVKHFLRRRFGYYTAFCHLFMFLSLFSAGLQPWSFSETYRFLLFCLYCFLCYAFRVPLLYLTYN